MPKLHVEVRIDPPPSVVSPEVFNTLCDGELEAFERWQAEQMQKKGLAPTPLIGAERGTIRAYLYFVTTRKEQP